MHIDTEDSKQLLAEVGRFARGRIADATARPDAPIESVLLEELTREANNLGILSLATAEFGFSIWEHCHQAEAMAFNIGALRHIGYANPGVAFAWHRIALARSLAEQVGFELDEVNILGTTLVSTGHYGLARTSVSRWLKAIDLQDDEVGLLTDWLDRRAHATTVYAPQAWQTMLWPIWRSGRIAWQLVGRDSLEVKPCQAQHGLDELSSFQVRGTSASGEIRAPDDEESRFIYGRLLKMDMIGLLAIAAGALVRGQELARNYSTIRKQGGKIIASHSAVQQMLSEIEVARHQADVALDAFARPIDEIDPGAVAATRASTHTLLCHAANQVMQVHGGIGYMREVGPEKLVRDQNMLKLLAGGTREVYSFLAGWIGEFA